MTLAKTKQEEFEPSSKIKDILIKLRNDFNLTNRFIAEKIGVDETHLSNVFGGRKAGSDQLLASLEMLFELTTIKQSEIRELEGKIKELKEKSDLAAKLTKKAMGDK